MRKFFPYLVLLIGGLCPPFCDGSGVAEAALLELRGRNPGPGGEIRTSLGQTTIIDVWMDGQGERIRTLNLFLRYDPELLRALDANPDKDGINPFLTKEYMPQPSEALNGLLADRGELIYGVTNLGDATASGAGVVASFQVEVVGPWIFAFHSASPRTK